MTTTSTEIPRTIRALITEVEAIGGEVYEVQPRRFEFHLPCRVVGGNVRLVNRGSVGYFVSEGKNRIKGVWAIRSEITYWARQSGRA
jgi:hypothetical protein